MTYTVFSRLVSEAAEQPDLDLYIAERGYQEDWMPAYSFDQIVGILRDIHMCVRAGDIASVVAVSGMSRRAFAMSRGIPVRSASNWCVSGAEKRSCPDYVRYLLLFSVICEKYTGTQKE